MCDYTEIMVKGVYEMGTQREIARQVWRVNSALTGILLQTLIPESGCSQFLTRLVFLWILYFQSLQGWYQKILSFESVPQLQKGHSFFKIPLISPGSAG